MLIKVIFGLIAAGVALAVIVRGIESRLAFFPTAGESTTPAAAGASFEASTIQTSDGERLRGWALPHPRPRALVVYFHGNGGNLSVWMPILVGAQAHGYAVRAIDYRGYGASTGRPTERGLYRDVDAAIGWARTAASPDVPVVYWGRSLGTAMAAYAATRQRPDGLVLEAGFRDVRSLFRASALLAFLSLFSSYRFPTAQFASAARCPVLVIHGDHDRVIPFEAGRALFDAVPEPKQFVTIRDGDHNDATPADPQTYWTAVDAFTASLVVGH
jgi:uncharacterized protein